MLQSGGERLASDLSQTPDPLPVLFLSEFATAWMWTSCLEIALRRGSLNTLSAALALACIVHISGGWTCARKVALLLQIAMGGGSLDNANLRSEMSQVVRCMIINPVCKCCKEKVQSFFVVDAVIGRFVTMPLEFVKRWWKFPSACDGLRRRRGP